MRRISSRGCCSAETAVLKQEADTAEGVGDSHWDVRGEYMDLLDHLCVCMTGTDSDRIRLCDCECAVEVRVFVFVVYSGSISSSVVSILLCHII